MRFVFAIVAFVIAAGMIAFGIAQRTVLAPPDRVVLEATTDTDAAFTVIDGSVLNSFPGQQRLVASGSDVVFASYARTSDVEAWLAGEPFNSIGYDAENETLTTEVVEKAASETTAPADLDEAASPPAPAGSDLWLDETSAERSLTWTVNVPDGISLLLASDGTEPAPSTVRISWPVSHSTPWAGPLIIGGGILLLIGLGLYIWGLVHMRRTRGPRRKSPQQKMPKLPAPPRVKTPKQRPLEPETTAKGRRSARRSVAVVALAAAGAVAMAGCSSGEIGEISEYFGEAPAPTPTVSASAQVAEEITPVAVTQPQVERIIESVAAVAGEADANRNLDLLKTRFTGPALQEREANYAMRGADEGIPGPDPIPSSQLRIDLPEATATWPRRVLAVVSGDDEAQAPTALILIQNTPRENYLVHYSMRLQADTEFPAVAPPTIGAAVIAPDNRLLAVQPDQLGPLYADVLARGPESESWGVFAEEPDGLRAQVGIDYKNAKREGLPGTASLEFSNGTGSGPIVGFATNVSGAIVATDIVERETVRPTEEGATVNLEGQVRALSGLSSSDTGVESTYGYQLLFYVPPSTDESAPVVLLGYAQGLISVREL